MEETKSNKVVKYTDIRKDLPKGQQLLAAGFREISEHDIEERFACQTLTIKFMEQIDEEKKKLGFKKSNQIKHELIEFTKPLYPKLSSWFNYTSITLALLTIIIPVVTGIIYNQQNFWYLLTLIPVIVAAGILSEYTDKVKVIRLTYPKCVFKRKRLDNYMKDIIPDRCIAKINLAVEFGMSKENMRIVYPVIEQGTEKITEEIKDPIIIHDDPLGNHLIEIDCWE